MEKNLRVENRTKRWREQRWLLDSIIKTVGPEWDQGHQAGELRRSRRGCLLSPLVNGNAG